MPVPQISHDQVDQLVQAGHISPELGNAMKQQIPQPAPQQAPLNSFVTQLPADVAQFVSGVNPDEQSAPAQEVSNQPQQPDLNALNAQAHEAFSQANPGELGPEYQKAKTDIMSELSKGSDTELEKDFKNGKISQNDLTNLKNKHGDLSPADVVKPNNITATIPATQSTLQPVDPVKHYNDVITAAQIGQIEGAKAGAAKAANDAVILHSAVNQAHQIANEQEKLRLQQQQTLDDQTNKLQNAIQEYHNTIIDPNHYWNTRSTGQKIAAAIGVVLGGVAQGGLGLRSNSAVDIINNAINKDIEAQKSEADKLKTNVALRSNLFTQMRQKFSDEQTALAATRVSAINNAQLQLKENAAKHQGPQIMANAEKVNAQLEVEKQKALGQFKAATLKAVQGQNKAYGEMVDELNTKLSSRSPAGLAKRMLIPVSKALSLYNEYKGDLDKMPSRQLNEFRAEVAAAISAQGTPTEEELKLVGGSTGWQKFKSTLEFLANTPTGAGAGGFLKKNLSYLQGIQKAMDQIYGTTVRNTFMGHYRELSLDQQREFANSPSYKKYFMNDPRFSSLTATQIAPSFQSNK